MHIEHSQRQRALFYHRDSGGRHDQAFAEYIEWAVSKSKALKLEFDGTAKRIAAMIKDCESVSGDIYLDYGVREHLMSRAALDQVPIRIKNDPTVSHLLIANRERFARPNFPHEAMQREVELRQMGVTIVYMDKVLGPLQIGQRADTAEQVIGLLDFDRTGRFREELAGKMIHAQTSLAKQGFSAGGRAPFGFRRWLLDSNGQPVRQLGDGEIVRQEGHHVGWQPGPHEELQLILRILDLLPTMRATRIAKLLNAEGIPTPDQGRSRKDHGLTHQVSGLWTAVTITNIARNTLLIAETSYGRRSMGDQRRHSPTGPRGLEASDLRTNGLPKVVQNPESSIIRSEAHFEPLIAQEKYAQLLAILDDRGKSQRGKPRSKDPSRNPLGCRVFDMACGSVMYRTPYKDSFRYVCGVYQQSNGDRCSHNHVDGMTATRFAIAAVQQMICSPTAKQKLEDRLRKRAAAEARAPADSRLLPGKQTLLNQIQKNLKLAHRNLALAKDENQHRAISEVVSELQRDLESCEREIATLQKIAKSRVSAEDQVASLRKMIVGLSQLAADCSNLGGIAELFDKLNLRMFLRFVPVQKKKRIENKLSGGVLTTGAAPLPIDTYAGPTSRLALKSKDSNPAELASAGDAEPNCSGLEAKSLGNVNRGDRI